MASVEQKQEDIEALKGQVRDLEAQLAEKERAAGPQPEDDRLEELFQRRRYLDELRRDLEDVAASPATSSDDAPFDVQSLGAPNGLAIVIGHSPEGDRGALGVTPPFPAESLMGKSEYYWNKDLAERIATRALARGVPTEIFHRLRNGGTGIREAYRQVKAWNPVAAVELHFNSADRPARGTETLYGVEQSKVWAKALQDKMVALYGREGRHDRGLKDAVAHGRGVQSLTTAVQPSALIEPFFAHVAEDAQLGVSLKDGLADAVLDAFVSAFAPVVAGGGPIAPDVAPPAPVPATLWSRLRDAASATSIEFPQLKGIAFAQWALESGHGSSPLATRHLNFAGMKWRPFMSDLAAQVWHRAHDGGEYYCKFDSLEKFIAGYWARLERHPSYSGWKAQAATPEGFFQFIANIWAPPSENPNYVPKVLALYERMKADGTLPAAGEPAVPPAAISGLDGASDAAATTEIPSDEDFWVDRTEAEAFAEAEDQSPEAAIARAASQADVKWAPDEKAFDYAHLESTQPLGIEFTFTAADLDLICRLNDFPVEEAGDQPVLFGLRGTAIVAGGSSADGQWRQEAVLKDRRPNHHETRCVMGVWNRKEGKIAVYPGSTVPNAAAVVNWFKTREAGNTLPTGLYRYICGVHNGKPGCFLLRESVDVKRKVIVRRTADNLVYEDTDIIQNMAPGDNIHPTFSNEPGWFSSLGCQVVVGWANTSGNHSGPWARFRRSAGFTDDNGEPNTPFMYVLFTGREALIASELRRGAQGSDPVAIQRLRRLRFGSKGPAVSALQAKLGMSAPTGDFGPDTAELLHAKQKSLAGARSDGIFTPKLDQSLGWAVLGPAGAPVG